MIHVCSVDDVPLGEGRNVAVGGRRLALFRAQDGWYATDAACPHKQGPLADGIVADCSVICPLHERRFSLATGEEIGGSLQVATYTVKVRGEQIYVELGAAVEGRSAVTLAA